MFCYRFEALFGYMADSSYCVTQAMKKDLMTNWRVTYVTVYYITRKKMKFYISVGIVELKAMKQGKLLVYFNSYFGRI